MRLREGLQVMDIPKHFCDLTGHLCFRLEWVSQTEHHCTLVPGSKLCDFILKNKATDAVEAGISNEADQGSDLLYLWVSSLSFLTLLILSQVGMGRNKTLYALEDGIVRYTKEVYVPPPRSSESRDVICQLPKGAILYKTFISVVPTTEVGSFKLVTML